MNSSSPSIQPGKSTLRRLLFSLLVAALIFASPALAKKPKKALKESDARRAIAATPGFSLNRGVVKVKDISLAGAIPVVVTADVELALSFAKVEGEKADGEDAAALWRAVEFRSGDRSWELFDYLIGPLSAEKIESLRATLEEMAAEFEAKQHERKQAEEGEKKERAEGESAEKKDGDNEEKVEKKDEKKNKKRDEKKEEEKIEVRRGPVVMKEFSPMYKSARAVVTIEASFRLEKDAKTKWRVAELTVGETTVSDFDRMIASMNQQKAVQARRDLDAIREALEAFRRERGFYVVAEDETVLIDHLAPRYLKNVIRIDPWHQPYGYEGTRDSFTLRSNGPDGKASTPDDITISNGRQSSE